MHTVRPLSPRLGIYRWLPAMVASIAHRASGVFLVVMMPATLCLLHLIAGDESTFALVMVSLHTPVGQGVLWLTATALAYHLLNGIRFLLLDAGVARSRSTMLMAAKLVLALTALLALVLAFWIFNAT
ncbi:MAG: succinate dehydrogenase, cytochrome b556 subunit [Mariprofundaceae bacterium]